MDVLSKLKQVISRGMPSDLNTSLCISLCIEVLMSVTSLQKDTFSRWLNV